MKNYIISGVLLLVLIGFGVLTGFTLIRGFEYGHYEVKPVNEVFNYGENIDTAKVYLAEALDGYKKEKVKLDEEKAKFDSIKAQYDSISNETIEKIIEAYKTHNYDLEWLWIVLGNYAKINNLEITIAEPENTENESKVLGNLTLTVRGRYLDVVDFVFDVETDKELLFKLDNMNMLYDKDNKIIATFDILTMNVVF